MSHRRLCGWEPKQFTEYRYDGEGRLSGSVVTCEPEFDTEQVDLLLALSALQRDIGPHGQLMSEATDEAADATNYDGGYRYVGRGPFTDHAEKAKQDCADAYKAAAGEKANLNGMYFTTEKVVD